MLYGRHCVYKERKFTVLSRCSVILFVTWLMSSFFELDIHTDMQATKSRRLALLFGHVCNVVHGKYWQRKSSTKAKIDKYIATKWQTSTMARDKFLGNRFRKLILLLLVFTALAFTVYWRWIKPMSLMILQGRESLSFWPPGPVPMPWMLKPKPGSHCNRTALCDSDTGNVEVSTPPPPTLLSVYVKSSPTNRTETDRFRIGGRFFAFNYDYS